MLRDTRSIAATVAIALVTATTIVLSGFGISNYRSEQNRLTSELHVDQVTWTEQLAVSLALPAWNFDHEQLNKVIDSSMRDKEIFAVVVQLMDVNGSIYARARDARWQIQTTDKVPVTVGYWLVVRDIVVSNDKLGIVTVYVTPKFLQASLSATLRWTIFTIMLFDALLICCLYLLLWTLVLKPLQTLEHHAAIISADTGHIDSLQQLRFKGELENLRSSLQNMVALLQKRYADLKLSEERFQLAVAGSNEGIWDWDRRSDAVYYSPRLKELLGYGPDDEFPPVPRSFWTRLHVSDRERVEASMLRHLHHHEPFNIEYRLKMRLGEYRWFHASAQATWDDEGTAIRVAGSINDVHEQRQTQESLRLAQERELQAREEFAQHLLTAQEVERQRLANELHDSVGQNLSLITNRAQLALRETGLSVSVTTHVSSIIQCTADAIAEVRALVNNLRPLHIEQLGLTESLESLLDQVAQSGHIAIERQLDNVDDVLQGSNATHVYRMVQEALNNVMKHARAQRVRVVLERDMHCIRLLVSDDGCGFAVRKSRLHGSGLGLTSISERAHILSGTLQIDSSPGQGTALRVELPISEKFVDAVDVEDLAADNDESR